MSDSSGRTVVTGPSPATAVRPRSALLRRRSYIPLAVLVVLSVIMATVGAATSNGWFSSATEGGSRSVPAACTSDVVPGDPAIWAGDRAPASEAVFAENTDSLTVPVVAGRDGFAFWSDVQAHNFSEILGRAPWLDRQREQWRGYFEDLRDGLERSGIELIVVVAPSPGTIYPEKLPDWAEPLRGRTHLDQLLEVSGDLPLVDVRGDLADAAEDRWVYSAVNSHWNPYGASVAWGSISECLRALYPESGYEDLVDTTVDEVQEQEPPNEFAEWGFAAPRQDWLVPTFEEVGATTTVTSSDGSVSELAWPTGIDMLDLPVTTAGGEIERKALVVGDSQGTAMSALWASSFESTTQIRHFLDEPSQRANVLHAARQSDADLVVFEMTERYFSLPAPTILN